MALNDRKLIILYGSQTGNAQEVAERIWREARCNNFHGPIKAMDEYSIADLIFEPLVVFVCSTTGQGEQPDNMKNFWKFLLRKNLPVDSLKNLWFAVLGLGDSSYVLFNHVAKKLHRRLEGLGGKMLCEVGLADEQHDLGADAVVDPWIKNLWIQLQSLFPVPLDITENTFPPSRWHVNTNEIQCLSTEKLLQWNDNTTVSVVVSNDRITHSQHFQDVRLIRLKSTLTYNPGDVLMVRPMNLPDKIDQILNLLENNKVHNLKPSSEINILAKDQDMPVPPALSSPISLYTCAQQYWDLNAVPKRYTFQLLCHFTTSDMERVKLEELTSAEGQEDLFRYCNRPRRTILEVLSDFPHATANIPLSYLFDIFQPIRQRAFSIGSSSLAYNEEVHIIVAVVKYKTSLVIPRIGLCSSWLASRSLNDRLSISVKKGSFRFPSDKNVPLLMVGPGTGVAPFRSLVQERVASNSASKSNLLLVFGNRNKDADFLMGHEWKSLENEDKISLLTAFSRDQPHKIYVQHVIEKEFNAISSWFRRGCWIYIAGNSKNMPDEVKSAFISIVMKMDDLSSEQAKEFITTLEHKGMYQTETWS